MRHSDYKVRRELKRSATRGVTMPSELRSLSPLPLLLAAAALFGCADDARCPEHTQRKGSQCIHPDGAMTNDAGDMDGGDTRGDGDATPGDGDRGDASDMHDGVAPFWRTGLTA